MKAFPEKTFIFKIRHLYIRMKTSSSLPGNVFIFSEKFMNFRTGRSTASQVEEEHTDQDQQKVDDLAFQVLLMEYHRSE